MLATLFRSNARRHLFLAFQRRTLVNTGTYLHLETFVLMNLKCMGPNTLLAQTLSTPQSPTDMDSSSTPLISVFWSIASFLSSQSLRR